MKSRCVRILRSVLRKLGLIVLHRSDDSLLSEMIAVRETLRVSPQLPAWKRDYLLSQLAAHGHLQALLGRLCVNLVIDVGANSGQFAFSLRSLGYTGRIVSFEPQSSHCAALQAKASMDGVWEVHQLAIGDAPGKLQLNVFQDSSLSSLHSANAEGKDRFPTYFELDHVENVEVRRLDDLTFLLGPFDQSTRILLKTDTQGHDLAVLQGAASLLPHCVSVLTEASIKPIYQSTPVFADIVDHLKTAGFCLSGIYPLAHDDKDMTLIEVDCCFVRPDGAVRP